MGWLGGKVGNEDGNRGEDTFKAVEKFNKEQKPDLAKQAQIEAARKAAAEKARNDNQGGPLGGNRTSGKPADDGWGNGR